MWSNVPGLPIPATATSLCAACPVPRGRTTHLRARREAFLGASAVMTRSRGSKSSPASTPETGLVERSSAVAARGFRSVRRCTCRLRPRHVTQYTSTRIGLGDARPTAPGAAGHHSLPPRAVDLREARSEPDRALGASARSARHAPRENRIDRGSTGATAAATQPRRAPRTGQAGRLRRREPRRRPASKQLSDRVQTRAFFVEIAEDFETRQVMTPSRRPRACEPGRRRHRPR